MAELRNSNCINSIESLHLAVDATNISGGGGLTHLTELLKVFDPDASRIRKITIWTKKSTAPKIPVRDWLEVRTLGWFFSANIPRFVFSQLILAWEIKKGRYDVLFAPGGTLPLLSPVPTVTMSQNMLPFEPDEARRFGKLSWMRFKMFLLRHAQGRAFRQADGVIFLTAYAQRTVSEHLNLSDNAKSALIPHGVDRRFFHIPRVQHEINNNSAARPFKFLYVSSLMPYKHQVEVALAIHKLRCDGLPVTLNLVGESWGRYGSQLRDLIQTLDPASDYLAWSGGIPFDQLHTCYHDADAFIFASSCENLPNIMIEAMASGLPIVCSNRGPMPEILGEAGEYFNPDDLNSLIAALRSTLRSPKNRSVNAEIASKKAVAYSWERCASDTMSFILIIASQSSRQRNV